VSTYSPHSFICRNEGVTFDINIDHCTIHGFAGTFESVLYQDVMISIAPQSHTEGMFSWFPLFIPLRDPVRVNRGDKITANFWRCVDARKVWYEWCLSGPVCTAVQNSGGKSYWIGL
jgi:type II protein arginine methyltransferase